MSRTNPRINAQKIILKELLDEKFQGVDDLPEGELPEFWYFQGITNYRKVMEEYLWRLDQEEAAWLSAHPSQDEAVQGGEHE